MPFTAAKLGAVHASVIVVLRGRRGAGSWKLAHVMAPSSRCAVADSSPSWVLVRLFGDRFFGDIVGILCSVWSGVFRRHHRSPALERKPAGQDPGRAFGTLRL